MRIYCPIIFLLIMHGALHAQPKNYDIATIPAELKKNAVSVKREETIGFQVMSPEKALCRTHRVITILNEAGKDQLVFYEFADRFHSLGEVEIELYSSTGSSLHKYSRSDLLKQAGGEGLVPDGKVYYLNIPAPSYPVTIRMDYEILYKGILNYPAYDVQLPEQSVENSGFTALVPSDMDLRYSARHTNMTPVTVTEGSNRVYRWSARNLPAMAYEEGSGKPENCFPQIILAPNKFELDGYEGDMSSWMGFGKWYDGLSKNTMNLSGQSKQFFQEMVKDAGDDKEKARRIYHYLQQNFRYVSIQLGIGGLRPFEADFVDKKKYGDCKALSNYTQACLDAVGIKSYKALVNSDYNAEPVDPDFPYNGFNHMILCVPLAADSVWLECTSATGDFGIPGSFTENRYALLITENGGKLVSTPRSRPSENEWSTKADIQLKENGSGNAIVNIKATGEYKQYLLHFFGDQPKDEQKRFLVNGLGFMQPDDFEMQYDKNQNPQNALVQMSMEKIPDFTAGNKMFLNPRIYKLWSQSLPKAENRTQHYYFRHPFIKTDSTFYHLPEGFNIKTLPADRSIQFDYGSFHTSCAFDKIQHTVTITARLILNKSRIPAAKFSETVKFFDQVLEEYDSKIVIERL